MNTVVKTGVRIRDIEIADDTLTAHLMVSHLRGGVAAWG